MVRRLVLPDVDADPQNRNWLQTPDWEKEFELADHLYPEARQKRLSDLYRKYNPNHVPAGTPEGGEFASGGGSAAGRAVGTPAPIPAMSVGFASATELDPTAPEVKSFLDEVSKRGEAHIGQPLPLTDPYAIFNAQDVMDGAIAKDIAKRTGVAAPAWDSMFHHGWNADTTKADGRFLQLAASKKWGISLSPSAQGDINMYANHPDTYKRYLDKATKGIDAVYAATQEDLSARGIKELTLYRGAGYASNRLPAELQDMSIDDEKDVTMQQNPLGSWSIDPGIAHGFSMNELQTRSDTDSGYVFATTVPAEDIVSTGLTGFGTAWQAEHILRGGTVHMRVKRTI